VAHTTPIKADCHREKGRKARRRGERRRAKNLADGMKNVSKHQIVDCQTQNVSDFHRNLVHYASIKPQLIPKAKGISMLIQANQSNVFEFEFFARFIFGNEFNIVDIANIVKSVKI
jgi:hypothetical protein